MQNISPKDELALMLKGSLLSFTEFFYKILTNREFIVSEPAGRESHHLTICKALTRAARLELKHHRLMINVAPGSGKSTLLCMYVAWCFAHYADCKFIYISYSKVLSSKNSEFIKRIMSLREYTELFDVHLRKDSKAKDYFQTTAGGHVYAAGSAGTITGFDAGSPGLDRISGGVIIDDAHKIDEAFSDTMRQSVIDNYSQTIQQRTRAENVPIISIAQRVHELDLSAHFIEGKDGYEWEKVIIKSLDEANNVIYPEVYSREMLLKRKDSDPYVFSSQYQQEPVPAGGALFKPQWFVMLDEEPTFISTFVVADTAETSKTYNDATAFGFFGLYEIESFGVKTKTYGLHWIDALEIHVEPKDLEQSFLSFYEFCCRHPSPPVFAAIEKKSTGTALISALSNIRGLIIKDIERNRSSGSKTKRFLDAQPYVAQKLVSFQRYAKHADLCIEHMSKITANDSHARDDLADILADAISLALASKAMTKVQEKRDFSNLTNHFSQQLSQRSKLYGV